MTFDGRERKVLKQLILDCDLYGLSQTDSLEYIKERYGKPISRSYYYEIKNVLFSVIFRQERDLIWGTRLDYWKYT